MSKFFIEHAFSLNKVRDVGIFILWVVLCVFVVQGCGGSGSTREEKDKSDTPDQHIPQLGDRQSPSGKLLHAVSDTFEVIDLVESQLHVLRNDQMTEGAKLTLVSVTQPEHGTISLIDNQIFYIADAKGAREDYFYYTIESNGEQDTAGVSLLIHKLDKDPDAVTRQISDIVGGAKLSYRPTNYVVTFVKSEERSTNIRQPSFVSCFPTADTGFFTEKDQFDMHQGEVETCFAILDNNMDFSFTQTKLIHTFYHKPNSGRHADRYFFPVH